MSRLFHLGEHRLLLGDSAKKEDLLLLLKDYPVPLVLTDPPYGISLAGKNKTKAIDRPFNSTPLVNDDIEDYQLSWLLFHCFNTIRDLNPTCAYYVCSSSVKLPMFFDLLHNQLKIPHRATLVWVKEHFVLAQSDYHPQSEFIIFSGTADKAHRVKTRNESNVVFCRRIDSSRNRFGYHPTRKPVQLFERLILNSSLPGDYVCDPFVGSGTTLLACERTGRKCLAAELSAEYVYMTMRYWRFYTNDQPIYEEIDGNLVEFHVPALAEKKSS